MTPQAKQQEPEPQEEQTQEPEVEVLVNLLGETRPLWQLMDQIGVPDGADYAEVVAQIAGLQGQIEQVKADFQARIDELRGEVGRAEQPKQQQRRGR